MNDVCAVPKLGPFCGATYASLGLHSFQRETKGEPPISGNPPMNPPSNRRQGKVSIGRTRFVSSVFFLTAAGFDCGFASMSPICVFSKLRGENISCPCFVDWWLGFGVEPLVLIQGG